MVSIIVDRCVAAGSVSSEDLSMVNAFFCAEICIHHAQRPSMVENLRKPEFDAAQPVRNQETGKVDYIVRVADHKTAEVASTIILTLGYALLRTAFTSHGVGGAVLPMSVHFSRRVSCLAFLETPLIIIER
jgi:hypothetical protein